jgi:hypothetical protein
MVRSDRSSLSGRLAQAPSSVVERRPNAQLTCGCVTPYVTLEPFSASYVAEIYKLTI